MESDSSEKLMNHIAELRKDTQVVVDLLHEFNILLGPILNRVKTRTVSDSDVSVLEKHRDKTRSALDMLKAKHLS
jgi:hypothetical protein